MHTIHQFDRPDPEASAKMLQRIRALLAKAEDAAATPAEAETYTAKATELMAKYGIDRALLAASDPTTDVVGDRIVRIEGSYAKDKQHLLSQVAMAVGCRTVLCTRYPDGVKQLQVHLFGFGADLERAEMLYTSLLVQAWNGLAQTEVPLYESATSFRKSWLAGFTSTVVRRLQRAEASAKQTAEQERAESGKSGPSVELVLADRSALVQHRLDDTYPKLGKAKSRRLNGSGYGQGALAGARADIGGTRLTGRSRVQVTR